MLLALVFVLVLAVVGVRDAAALSIDTQPVSVVADVGSSASFTVAASGTTLQFEWKRNGAVISERVPDSLTGQGTHTLTIGSVATTDADSYSCVVTDTDTSQSTESSVVTLQVRESPTLLEQPTDVAASLGGTLVLRATATTDAAWGTATISWYNADTGVAVATGSDVAVATSTSGTEVTSSLTLSPLGQSHEGRYLVVVAQDGALTTQGDAFVVGVTAVPTNAPAFSHADKSFVALVDTDGRAGFVGGRVNFVRADDEMPGEPEAIAGYKLYTTNGVRSQTPLFVGSVSDWEANWRAVTTAELADAVCTTVSGSAVATVDTDGVLQFSGFSAIASVVRCDIAVNTTFGDGIRGVRGSANIHPYSSSGKLQHPSNNAQIDAWGGGCADSNGYVAIGTDVQVVDNGAGSGSDFVTHVMRTHPIAVSEASVNRSTVVRVEVCQSMGTADFALTDLSLDISELGLSGTVLTGSAGSVHGVQLETALDTSTATALDVVAFNWDGDGAFNTLTLEDLTFPTNPPSALVVGPDQQPDALVVTVAVCVASAADESDVEGYNLYLGLGGTSASAKHPDANALPLGFVNATTAADAHGCRNTSLSNVVLGSMFAIADVTVPTHLLAFSVGGGGESTEGATAVVTDLATPVHTPTLLTTATDTNPKKGVVSLVLELDPAPSGEDTDVTHYALYFANGGAQGGVLTASAKFPDASVSPAALVAAGASGEVLEVSITDASIPYTDASLAPAMRATHIIAFSVNSDGESTYAVGVEFSDTECGSPLGLTTDDDAPFGVLADTALSASSSAASFPPSDGRLDGGSVWCANAVEDQYYQVNFTRPMNVHAVATRGGNGAYVESFSLWYVREGGTWQSVEDPSEGTAAVFTANQDTTGTVTNLLASMMEGVVAVRVVPVAYSTAVCVALELYGCAADVPTDVPVAFSFKDEELSSSHITGTGVITQPDEMSSALTHWAVYLGYGEGLARAYQLPVAVVEKDAVGDGHGTVPILVSVAIDTEVYSQATHFEVVGLNGVGSDRVEAATALFAPIADQTGPEETVTTVAFTDEDIDSGSIGGTLEWLGALLENQIARYEVWWGDSATHAIGSALATVLPGEDYSFAVASGTALATASGTATHFLVFVVSQSGEYNPTPGQVRIVDLIGPAEAPTALSFTDTDTRSGFIAGSLAFSLSSSTATSCAAYLGASATAKYADASIATASVGDAFVTIPATAFGNATHLLLFAVGGSTEGAVPASIALTDQTGPQAPPTSVSAIDTNVQENVLTANVTWTASNPDTDVSAYEVWLGDASREAMGSALGTVASSSTPILELSGVDITGASNVLVFAVSDAGVANPTAASTPLVDLVGVSLGMAVAFVDTDTAEGVVGGSVDVVVEGALGDVSSFELWFGSDATTRVGDSATSSVSAATTFAFSLASVSVPATASFLLVVAVDSGARRSSVPGFLALEDLVGPRGVAYNVHFNNTSTDTTTLTGAVRWTEPNDTTSLDRYEVWLGDSPTTRLGDSAVLSVSLGGHPAQSVATSYLAAVTHILVYSVDASGTRNPVPAFTRVSANARITLPLGASVTMNGGSLTIGAKTGPPYATSCADAKANKFLSTGYSRRSGWYVIQGDATQVPTRVYCDMSGVGVQVSGV